MTIRRTTLCALLAGVALVGCGTRNVNSASMIGLDQCRGGKGAPALVCDQRSLESLPSAADLLPISSVAATTHPPTTVGATTTGAPTTVAPTTEAPTTAAPAESTAAAPAADAAAPSDEQPAADAPAPEEQAADEQPAEEPDTTAARKKAPRPKSTPAPKPAPAPAPAPAANPAPAPAPAPDPQPAPQPEPDPAPAPPPPAPAASAGPAGLASQVVAMTNAERAKAGLGALTVSSKLTASAAGHSADQASHNTMSHTGSDGSSMSQRISATGFAWRALGENVAMGYRSASAVMTGWMNSAGHRKNILTPGFTMIGVAVAVAGDGSYYWTMDLATPA